jgi:DNA-directed RNA polymerase subunit RPC12/RpoP
MSFIDTKYIHLVSPQLQKFVQKNSNTFNFRCPYCGDSKKHQNKARGYFFKIKNDFVYKCHNCGIGRTFTNFLKDQNMMLHDQYVMERYKEGLTGKGTQTATPNFNFQEPVFFSKNEKSIDLEKVSELNKSHPAREYLEQRKIEDLEYFYYCPKFKDWTNKQKKIFDNLKQDSSRIIIPLKDNEGNMFGYQGRSLAPKAKLRYITVMLDESRQKIFGLDKIDTNKDVYVTEGPFDSTFITNSIAMCGSDVDLGGFDYKFIFVFDNEPRNKEIVSKIYKTISDGHRVVIFPKSIIEKDINDMVLAGHNVQEVVESNIYQGLEAKLKLNEWKKV